MRSGGQSQAHGWHVRVRDTNNIHPIHIPQYIRPHDPSYTLWEWVLLLLYGGDRGSCSDLLAGCRREHREGC